MASIVQQLLYLLLLYISLASAEYGLVEAPGECRVQCMNHGVCVYQLNNPSKHSCICLQGSFFGEFCQYSAHGSHSTMHNEPISYSLQTTTPQKTRVIFGALEDTGIHEDNELDDEPHTVGGSVTETINNHLLDKVIPVDSEEGEHANMKKDTEEPVMVSEGFIQPQYQTDQSDSVIVTNVKKDENDDDSKVSATVEQNLAYADDNYMHTYHGHNRLQYKTLSEKSAAEMKTDISKSDNENDLESESGSWMMARKPREFSVSSSSSGLISLMLTLIYYVLINVL